ncbi:MAG: hypothetical protein SCARUB_00639 [Candidatus Scalindua rubra]|uniref:Uncharacterized protein n=1 Tax=Candidatus Scalindua rubra TaxID=1872076 RepID=A0A1E3XF55_9BACT|nr:MAG: hypothetical protein SCARUB_00639 [Candidatus Scalindua rubra]
MNADYKDFKRKVFDNITKLSLALKSSYLYVSVKICVLFDLK